MVETCQYNPERDIKPVDELPLEAYDTAYQYATGTISSEAVTANKTFNGASLGQIKGLIRDSFIEMEAHRAFSNSNPQQNDNGTDKSAGQTESASAE